MRYLMSCILASVLFLPGRTHAEDPKFAVANIEPIAAAVRKSVVVITHAGRDGKRQGLGTGFVVSADGLIATNLHVIGEGRPISVQLEDKRQFEVTTVHASDRASDLAVIRINAQGLTPLPLGDSEQLKDGQPVVAVGNPHGLNHSVVSGVVSGKRTIDGLPIIQLAIPIEKGNSGGPLLDLQGRVHGILTMKSAVTANLGFAVSVNTLKTLLAKPNPLPMSRWATLGVLDPTEWETIAGARWRARGGRIQVEGTGTGFGGRALCLSRQAVPEVPFEVAVTVRLEEESGAAGLAFHADGGDLHYGFYPSAGQLRLTRFDGPDVFSWKILHQEASRHYRPGDWNTLKVRIEKDRLLCYVNGHLAVESTDRGLTSGRVGLAKFRDTKAEFKGFQVGRELKEAAPPAEVVQRLQKMIADLDGNRVRPTESAERLAAEAGTAVALLRDRARKLEEEAVRLRDLAQTVHRRRIQNELAQLLKTEEDKIDLLHAALLIARLDNDELDIEPYRRQVERMARDVKKSLPAKANDPQKLEALNKYLFTEQGFHGSRADYYSRANSYLNDVLDDREGLPLTLSILYLELGRRIDLPLVGIGLPGHFVVRHMPANGEGNLIDVYDGGKELSRTDAEARVKEITRRPLRAEHLQPMTRKAILQRMLHNLLGVAQREGQPRDMLGYLDTLLTLDPEAAEERGQRAAVRFQLGDRVGALEDLDWLLQHRPEGLDVERVQEMRRVIERSK